MHHSYSKGDQLCPLGFHPQVRWPTRCKRCFRDYKEHGSKRNGEDIAASSPSLSLSSSSRDNRENTLASRSWTSSTNLSSLTTSDSIPKRPSSWTSTPDLDEAKSTVKPDISFSISLPKRRHTANLDLTLPKFEDSVNASVTIKRPPLPPRENKSIDKEKVEEVTILKSDSLAERVRKMQLLKKQNSVERETSRERSVPKKTEKDDPPPQPTVKKKIERKDPKATISPEIKKIPKTDNNLSHNNINSNSQDVQFLIQVKTTNKKQVKDDSSSLSTCTDTTENTLVDRNDSELLDQIQSLKSELVVVKQRAERAERDKSDIRMRHLASIDTVSNRTAATEALKLQQKVNELRQQVEELTDEKKIYSIRVRELETDLMSRPAQKVEDDLRAKLLAAETLCEELMDENEDMKRELRNVETEMDEMQDNFREDHADEYSNIKKELTQTTKNCRILSFKLKKSERRIEQLEGEKQAGGNESAAQLTAKIKVLEEELKAAHEVSRRLQTEAEQAEKNSTTSKKRAPTLGTIGKSTSADGKYSRESITRGGSQDDPVKLMRDLQDSMEREADLREQLKFAEEEAESLRKKASRVEDENESLMMQLKKMATKARSRKLSPTAPVNRLSPKTVMEKDEGISDEEDPAELRVLLDLNEQEASVLRRKVEELESENETIRKQSLELQEKLKSDDKPTASKKLPSFLSKTSSTGNATADKKIKSLEDEVNDLKKKVTEKDKSIEKLQSADAKLKGKAVVKSKSLEIGDQNVDTKRQLQIIEQEVDVQRGKIVSLEDENEKLAVENKKLSLQAARAGKKDSTEASEILKSKESLAKIQKERDELNDKLKRVVDELVEKLPPRTPKKFIETYTKSQFKKIIDDLEDEITEMRAIVVRTKANKLQDVEKEKSQLEKELKQFKDKLDTANSEIKTLKTKQDTLSSKSSKLADIEVKLKTTEVDKEKLADKIKMLEEKINKQDVLIKQIEKAKSLLDTQIQTEKDNKTKIDKDLEKERKEKKQLETKLSDLDSDYQTYKKATDKIKLKFEKDITALKKSSAATESQKVTDLNAKISELESTVAKDAKIYADLTGKYEVLEEEHVLTKAQLTSEKEKLTAEINSVKSQLSKSKADETKYKQENAELNKKLTDSQSKLTRLEASSSNSTSSNETEQARLKMKLNDREEELQKLKGENEMNNNLANQLKRENDDVRRKLDDFERVSKVHRNLSEHNNSLEQELKKLHMKLENAEMSVKSEVGATRLRYEQQVSNLQAEISSIQRQCERFKRDRDTFKQLLEGAQKSMADLKSGRASRSSNTSGDEDDKSKIHTLEQQIGCLEDELSEARLESSKIKTELVSERSTSEVKISEMQSKMNEYEEEKILSGGRTKIPGMKTRLELSWQKEREELSRLLQETSTLARDLRQTLFEVEREKDKEKLESRRKLDQLKKATEEEMEEGRRKISELQCDLLELRDAHAKLRTANEKLRRERERYEKDRENTTKKRMEQDGERKVGALLQTVEEFVKIAPDLKIIPSTTMKSSTQTSTTLQTPNSLRRSPSPANGTAQQSTQITNILGRLAEAYEELRKFQKISDDDKERERFKRGTMRRAASTETDETQLKTRGSRTSHNGGSLYRKSLSLDQSIHQDQLIWKQDDGSMSSIQSIDSEYNSYRGSMNRESSMDSRLSGGSTQSDIQRGTRKKKRGFMGKLRSLTKSRGGTESDGGSQRGSDSDLSISGDHRSSKKDLKERLSGMFRRSGSRNSSTEVLDSSRRPVAISVTTIENGPASTPGTPHLKRTVAKPPPSTSSTPSSQRKNK